MNGTLYILGTDVGSSHGLFDVFSDLQIGSPSFGGTHAVQAALVALGGGRPDRIVGHSLGGAVASYLGGQLGVFNVGYGSPVKNDENFADPRDPVGLFVSSKPIVNNTIFHHSVKGYVVPRVA